MKPRLLAIAGPLKGTVFELPAADVSIGRDSSNQLVLDDKSTSRHHAVIKHTEAGFTIADLGSHNGTLVNDVRCEEQFLRQADRIQLGSSYFLFLEGNSMSSSEKVELDNGSLITNSKLQLRLEDALYLLARDLSTLIGISARINTARSLEALQRLLLESIFEIIPAERGAIILAEDDMEQPHSVFALNRFPDRAPVTVSSTVTRQVLKEAVSILSNDIVHSETLNQSEAIVAARVTALLCVPLQVFSKTIGVIYLDRSKPGAGFTEGQLKMLTAIAGFVAGSLENVRHMEWLESERQRLQSDIQLEHTMIGDSPRMQEVYQLISKVAPTDSNVLIRGESGTGKELAARAVHENGPRARRPFVAVNCAALTESLLESELFGHERGAFTGAIAQKKGKLEIADGGTIFLDEVGELSLPIQSKLLRVLQEREFEHVGGTRTIKVDVRIIAATNKNIEQSVSAGGFRQDLYYRLNVITLTMPPLRERVGDIPLLARHFVAKYSHKCKRQVSGISPQARECLVNYRWPGNVRELENTIERALVLGSTDIIQMEDVPDNILESAVPSAREVPLYYESIKEAKIRIIQNAVESANGNYTEAAKVLGVHPNNLHRMMRNLGMKDPKAPPS